MMNEPCFCGAVDCPACRPGCLDKFECAACGETKYSYQMHDNNVCEDCHEEGFGVCECCGEVDTLVDAGQCAKCWAEELQEACVC